MAKKPGAIINQCMSDLQIPMYRAREIRKLSKEKTNNS